MTANPFDAQRRDIPVSIHDFVLQELPDALRKLKEGYRELTVIDWMKQTLGNNLVEGITLDGSRHRSSPTAASDFDRVSDILRSRLTKTGFAEDDVARYMETLKKRTTEDTLKAIKTAVEAKQELKVIPY